ncbi:MAG: hypothetical protein KJ990_12145 [Proteobacteria bacterium]|nr:hypothetical protein [Pseudomonadota bacterium]MBU1649881.1 hypothetical protein [Pseudomonadota bacterium]
MGLFDAIDKLLEPITKKIFATFIGKNMKLINIEEIKRMGEPDFEYDSSYRWGND